MGRSRVKHPWVLERSSKRPAKPKLPVHLHDQLFVIVLVAVGKVEVLRGDAVHVFLYGGDKTYQGNDGMVQLSSLYMYKQAKER
jgi:hypothetical protein